MHFPPALFKTSPVTVSLLKIYLYIFVRFVTEPITFELLRTTVDMWFVLYRLPSGMTYEPPTAWNWSGPTDNACSYYPPQSDPFGFYSAPQPRLPFFPDMGISPYPSTNEVDYTISNGQLTFIGNQSSSRCGNGVIPVKDEQQLDNSNDRFFMSTFIFIDILYQLFPNSVTGETWVSSHNTTCPWITLPEMSYARSDNLHGVSIKCSVEFWKWLCKISTDF